MKIEEIFQQTLGSLMGKIQEFQKTNPALVKAFGISEKDPQAEKLIAACALISANLQEEFGEKLSRDLRSILLNTREKEFNSIAPLGIIKGSSKIFSIIKQGQVIRSGEEIFRVARETSISDLYITSSKINYEKLELAMEIEGNFENVMRIDFFTNQTLMSNLFGSKLLKACQIFCDDKVFERDFEMNDVNLKEFVFFPERNCFFSLKDLGFIKSRKITIVTKLNHQMDLKDLKVELNSILVENVFANQTNSLVVNSSQNEYDLLVGRNEEIIRVTNVKNDQGKVIPHSKFSGEGWFLIAKDNGFALHLTNVQTGILQVEVECMNNEFTFETPFFDEFFPVKLEWQVLPSTSKRFVLKSDTRKIMNYLNSYDKDVLTRFYSILSYFSIYDTENTVKMTDIEVLDCVKPKVFGNQVIASVGYQIFCKSNTSNYLLLRSIWNAMNEYCTEGSFVDFVFETKDGEISFQEEF